MKAPPSHLRSWHGVTLIELLVAAGIIVILASLLLPVIRGAGKAAGNAKCISNLRTTGGMLQLLIADSNQRLITRAGGNTLSGYYIWSDLLWRRGYLSPSGAPNTTPDPDLLKVLRCPSAPCSPQAWYWYAYGLNMYDSRGVLDLRGPNKDARIFELNLARIVDTASYPLLVDSISGNGETQTFRVAAKPTFTDGIELRHNGKGHVYFLDGHISALDRKAAEVVGLPNIYDAFRRD